MNACKLVGLLLLLLWGHTTLYAQQVRTVRGRVQTVEAGSNEKRALPSASIVILAKSDSAFIKGITSDKNGRFVLNYQPQKKKKYLLKVSFRLSLKPWGIALKFLFLHHENILFPND